MTTNREAGAGPWDAKKEPRNGRALIAPEYAALREVCSAEELAERRARNEARAREQIAQLGDRYLCHPDNYIRPVPQERGVLYLSRR